MTSPQKKKRKGSRFTTPTKQPDGARVVEATKRKNREHADDDDESSLSPEEQDSEGEDNEVDLHTEIHEGQEEDGDVEYPGYETDYKGDGGLHVAADLGWKKHTNDDNSFMAVMGRVFRGKKDNLPTYRGPKPGPRSIPAGTKRPIDFFQLLFTSDWLEKMSEATRAKLSSVYPKKKYDLSASDLLHFWAIELYMGVVRKPEMEMHWDTDRMLGSPFVRELMPRDRWRSIRRCFSVQDTTKLSEETKKKRNKKNPYWREQPWLDDVAKNFGKYYKSGQVIVVDEMGIAYKGHFTALCYNPNKPHKYHLKVFVLADAKSKYLMDFKMYKGKESENEVGGEGSYRYEIINQTDRFCLPHITQELERMQSTATVYPVTYLTRDANTYHNNGTLMITDNWYTSPKLAAHMKENGIDLIGTVRTGRAQGFGKTTNADRVKGRKKLDVLFKKKNCKKKKGQWECYKGDLTGTTGNGPTPIFFAQWMDSKPVFFLSTVEPRPSKLLRKQKGQKDRVEIGAPDIVRFYNDWMNGVDVFDQLIQYYIPLHRSHDVHYLVVRHFVMVCVVNSYILYKEHQKKPTLPLLDYLNQLIREMAKEKVGGGASDDDEDDEQEGEAEENNDKSPIKRPQDSAFAPKFDPRVQINVRHECANVSERSMCVVCSRKIATCCPGCNYVPLCQTVIGKDRSYIRDCFRKWHKAPGTYPKRADRTKSGQANQKAQKRALTPATKKAPEGQHWKKRRLG